MSRAGLEKVCANFATLANLELSKEDGEDSEGASSCNGLTLLGCALAVRNSCVCEENLDCILKHDGQVFALIRLLLRKLALTSHKYEVDTKLIYILCQIIANANACGSINAQHSFIDMDSCSLFKDAIAAAARVKSRKALGAAIAGLYNSTCRHDDEDKDSINSKKTRFEKICNDRALWCQMLLALVAPFTQQTQTTVIDIDVSNEINNDPAMEWMHILACKVVSQGKFSDVFSLLASTSTSNNCESSNKKNENVEIWGAGKSIDTVDTVLGQRSREKMNTQVSQIDWFVVHEQIIFLQTIRDTLEDESFISANQNNQLSEHEEDVVNFIVLLTQNVCSLTKTRFNDLESEVHKSLWLSAVPAVAGVVGAFISISCLSTFWSVRRPQIVQTSSIIAFYVQTLSCLPNGLADSTEEEQVQDNTNTPALLESMYHDNAMVDIVFTRELVKDILALLGNLCYRCAEAQDHFRESGGFVVVLPLCATDLENPLAREWAMLCMRNVCEGNMQNQAFVESLQPQGNYEVRDEAMKAAGKFRYMSYRVIEL